MFSTIREAIRISREKRAKKKDAEERRRIAKAFNDRYTFRKMYDDSKDILPSHRWLRGGNAWMCPSCNVIHYPVEISVFSGLQYPACCNYVEGHRLDDGIRLK